MPAAVRDNPDRTEFSGSGDGSAADSAGHPGGTTATVRSAAVSAAAVHVPDQSCPESVANRRIYPLGMFDESENLDSTIGENSGIRLV